MVTFLAEDDATPITDVAIDGFEAGADSTAQAIHVWSNQGDPGGEDLEDLLLAVYVEDPAAPGQWLRSGVAPLDELWAQVRLVGQDNTARPEQPALLTDWLALGAGSALHIPSLLSGCARYLELKFHPPSSAAEAPWRFRLGPIVAEHAQPVPLGLSQVDCGVLTGLGDGSRSGLVRGGEVAPAGPADDTVTVAPAMWLYRGGWRSDVSALLTLSQLDGAGAALGAGESYVVAVSLGDAGAVGTKGPKAAAPQAPAPPAGDTPPLAWVTVRYQAGGTSVIEAGDIEDRRLFDRLVVVPGVGLEVILHPGYAIGGGSWRYRSAAMPLALPGTATRYLWQLASGLPELTATPARPQSGALPLAEIDTDATDVTAIRDRRRFAGGSVVIALAGSPAAPGVLASQLVWQRLAVERFVVRLSDDGAGTGQTQVSYDVDGATAFTSFATDDQRPAFPVGTSELVSEDAYPEVVVIQPGQELALRIDELPDTTPPDRIEAYWVCREV
ncbi:MAG TPA: hypothetical protein VF017_15570 [Thermoanaerobaculia bacterium]|nr:hypothetical protein [Thermoanaerobaculia bacterium]